MSAAFTEETAERAMKILSIRDPDKTYAHIKTDIQEFECSMEDNKTFLAHKTTESTSQTLMTNWILPYEEATISNLFLEKSKQLSARTPRTCELCDEPNADHEYTREYDEMISSFIIAHENCAKDYNSALYSIKRDVEPHHEEILSKIAATKL